MILPQLDVRKNFDCGILSYFFSSDYYVYLDNSFQSERRAKSLPPLTDYNKTYSMAPACTAVIAITPTISSALQPLDKSLTGLAIPCVIGPYASAFANLCVNL